MNEISLSNHNIASPIESSIANSIDKLDSRSFLILAGIVGTTIISCIGFVTLTGSELSIDQSGVKISQQRQNN